MSEKSTPLLPDDEQARDRLRAILVLACVVAVVLAGSVVPAVSSGGLGKTPLGSVMPQPGVDVSGQSGSSAGRLPSNGGGELGALNPGNQTDVGGSLASNESAFQSQNAAVHFTVRSTTPSYWRTGAYDTYTGSGWEQSGDRRPYNGPVEGDGISGRKVEYRVTLQRSATALPSVWRANAISGEGLGSLFVTDQRAFETGEPVPSGTTYSGVSHLAPRDPTVLRTAGRDYPAEIERRYTTLPESSERRVAAFAANLTEGSDSPYESAKRIEAWLESNKNYSLNVSPPEEDVASQFIFEMEKGYCEYYATTMAVMLRSQDIPARYVVGYSTGQQVGTNTYEVRAMNAHAWVEVYFTDVGWVKFDPTPGQSRLQSEREAYQNQTSDDASDYAPTEQGSPGEQFSPNESGQATPPQKGTSTPSGTASGTDGDRGTTQTVAESSPTADGTTSGDATATVDGTATTDSTGETTTRTDDTTTRTDDTTTPPDGDGSSTQTGYEIELNRTPVPGATVEVTVTDNATVVVGASVYFNRERVGVTDESGSVTADVPYAENLTITVGTERQASGIAAPPANFDAPMALTAGPPPILSDDPAQAESLDDPPRAQSSENGTDDNRTDDSQSNDERTGTEYSLATNATLAVTGDVETRSRVVVTATVYGVPVRDAEVTLDGDPVGTTDDNGRVEVRLPDAPGNATIAVSRGPISGETTVFIPRLAVDVSPALPLALPGTGVEICATYGGDPVSDARVRLGDVNRSTDFNGSAVATLPFRGSATVVVAAHGQTARTTLSGLFVNLALVLGGGAVVLGGLAFGAYRRGVGPRRLVAILRIGLRAIPDLVVAVLFGLADRLEWTVKTVLDAVTALLAGETTVGELLARFRAWLRERTQKARANASATLDSASGRTHDGDGERADDSYRTLREAWASFLRQLSVRRPHASTPGELADHAVREDDLPPGAVVTLRDAFRDVEYGARSPADRLPRVEDAIETIERATREDEADADDSNDEASGGEA